MMPRNNNNKKKKNKIFFVCYDLRGKYDIILSENGSL